MKQLGAFGSITTCFNCSFAKNNRKHAENWRFSIGLHYSLLYILPLYLLQLCYNGVCLLWIDNLIQFAINFSFPIDAIFTLSAILGLLMLLLLPTIIPKINLWNTKRDLRNATKAKDSLSGTVPNDPVIQCPGCNVQSLENFKFCATCGNHLN